MAKFHINKHGVPAPCKAKPGNCPLGGDETHFNSPEEAQVAADKMNEEKHGIIPGMREKTIDYMNRKENMILDGLSSNEETTIILALEKELKKFKGLLKQDDDWFWKEKVNTIYRIFEKMGYDKEFVDKHILSEE